ncbi:MAG: hypothetical protein ABIA21_02840 [Candidatus Aenigmatarchaeota archaeon]
MQYKGKIGKAVERVATTVALGVYLTMSAFGCGGSSSSPAGVTLTQDPLMGRCNPTVSYDQRTGQYVKNPSTDFTDVEASSDDMKAQYNNLANVQDNADVSDLGKALRDVSDFCAQNDALRVIYDASGLTNAVRFTHGPDCDDTDVTGFDAEEIKRIANTLLAAVNNDHALSCPSSGYY